MDAGRVRWGRVLPVAVLLGLLFGSVGATVVLLREPGRVVARARAPLAEQGWALAVDGGTFETDCGAAGDRWCWRFGAVELLGLRAGRPTLLLADLEIGLPRPGATLHGPALVVPWATVGAFALHFEEVVPQEEPPPARPGGLGFAVRELALGRFGLTMREGRGPAVVAEAEEVGLISPFEVRPAARAFHGELTLEHASVEVAGVVIDEVVPERIVFTGPGLDLVARARLGEVVMDATLGVSPLIGRAGVDLRARLHESSLDAIVDAILGPGDLEALGQVQGDVHLRAGGALGPRRLEGEATVDVRDAGFSKPEKGKALVTLAVDLAPFLHHDAERHVIVGDLHGGVSFTERGVSFDSLTYEAPHSVAELRGYVRSRGVSAKLHFHPREGSAAIEWGFVLHGPLRRPKVALAVPAALRKWTPCEDPLHCAVAGGASTAP
ncbi:MAG: hypothetical protein H6732_07555 [Alphaproteobacteria bacterium]|nr:hypothetical protein [Alphaproteobacteria bacterium]